MLNKFLKINKGFTLLEVIIAIFIISVGVGGVAAMMPSLISGSSLNQSRLTAAYLAQEGIEIVRSIRDTNWLEDHYGGTPVDWNDGLDPCASGCEVDYTFIAESLPLLPAYGSGRYLNIDPNGLYGYDGSVRTKFKRKITVEENSDILTITVNIYWDDRGKSYEFPVQEKLYKWY
jgi:prepilin-type N-terminal cleavage/methylation domain-containing protein